MPALFKIISLFYVFMMNFSDGYRFECRDLLENKCDGLMMYTRGGSGGSGSCPGSLDNCMALCPTRPVGGHLHKKKNNNLPHLKFIKIPRRGNSRRAWLPAADGVTRNNAII